MIAPCQDERRGVEETKYKLEIDLGTYELKVYTARMQLSGENAASSPE